MVSAAFSVVIATYHRGALIEATLESVARQSVRDLEVLVVSDGSAAPGLADTVARFGPRFRLFETSERFGSQYGPNNYGWSAAVGRFIAYLGHDDIWLPHHLATLLRTFEEHPEAQFAASGCVFFGPPGSGAGHTWVTGLFDPADRAAALTHFFPPSSVAHLRDLPQAVRWPDAHASRRPVDSQFMVSAAERGCVFTSTGEVTVLKFNSAFRYLSYLSPDDDEQRAALELLDDPQRLDEAVCAALDDARSSGRFMTTVHLDEMARQPGEMVRTHARIRGIDTPPVDVLAGPTTVPLGDDQRAFDWYQPEGDEQRMWRWSGPNPRPRLLLPYTHDGPVRITLTVEPFAAADVRASLEVLVDRRSVPVSVQRAPDSELALVEIEATLRSDRPSVLELRMNRSVPVVEFVPGMLDDRRVGLCLTGILLTPLPPSPGSAEDDGRSCPSDTSPAAAAPASWLRRRGWLGGRVARRTRGSSRQEP